MFLARVIGRVVATRRVTGLTGEKLLIVAPLDEYGEQAGDSLVATDVAHSGPGDMVHVCDGREAALALPENFVPVDASIVGHVEQFDHRALPSRGGGTRAGPTRRRTADRERGARQGRQPS